jgi:hypothetical protein
MADRLADLQMRRRATTAYGSQHPQRTSWWWVVQRNNIALPGAFHDNQGRAHTYGGDINIFDFNV